MHINKNGTIRDLQRDFHTVYPFLKIEFYKRPHQPGEKFPQRDRLRADFPLANMASHSWKEFLDISHDRKVVEVEKELGEMSGQFVQVFRRSGNTWMQTTHTDKWSLRMQNEEGESSCIHRVEKPGDADLEDID